jgi:hypothetical protein
LEHQKELYTLKEISQELVGKHGNFINYISLDPNTMTTFPGCKVGVFTIDTDYPNNEWHVKRSYVNLEKD